MRRQLVAQAAKRQRAAFGHPLPQFADLAQQGVNLPLLAGDDLVQLVEQQGKGQASIPNAPTHQELAIMINASRETVTRAFQVLILQQIVLRDGNQLKILKPDYLVGIKDARIDQPKT